MKKLLMLAPLALAVACASGEEEGKKDGENKGGEEVAEATAVTYTVSEGSNVEFTGEKGPEASEPGSHGGTLAITSGTMTVDNGVVTMGEFTIDMTSMQTDAGDKLVGHLSDSTFFNVSAYPEATFVVTSHEGDNLNGTLTLMGNEFPVTLTVENITETEEGLTAAAMGSLELGEMAPPAFEAIKLLTSIPITVNLMAAK